MDDEPSVSHHARPPRPPIPLQYGPESPERQFQTPLPDTVSFIDRQLHMWCTPVYRGVLVDSILSETSLSADERPGKSDLARRWEENLAQLANDETLDDQSLQGDPYEKVFEQAYEMAQGDPQKTAIVTKLERLYKRRELSMDTHQQYEKPLPPDLDLLLGLMLHDV